MSSAPPNLRSNRFGGRGVRSVSSLAAAAVLAFGSSAALAPAAIAQEAPAAEAPAQALNWGPCPERVTTPTAVCATLKVPMDYDNPEGEKIDISVVKHPAADPSQRRGALFGNSGGPNGDVLSYFDDGLFTWPQELRNEFDLIGVQPRGLPDSTPVDCTGAELIDPVTSVTHGGGALRAACEQNTPGYTEHVNTENTARDWEEVRKALGEEKIDIFGLSYGTLLGSTYASLFPAQTDKLVLDSGVSPNHVWNGLLNAQDPGYKKRTHDMFEWIAQNDETYHLGDTALKVYQRWSDLIVEEVGVNPSVAPPPAQVGDVPPAFTALAQQYIDGTNLTNPARVQLENLVGTLMNPGTAQQANSMVLNQTRNSVPQSASWPYLAEAIAEGLGAGAETEEIPDLDTPMADALQPIFMQQIVLCNENQVPPNPLSYPEFLWTSFVSGDVYDMYGAMYDSGAACAGFPATTKLPALSGDALETKPLQLQGLGDPQTPYQPGMVLANQMRAHVITVGGGDHGQFAKGNETVDSAVLEYLRTGHTGVTEAPAPPIPMPET
ncbi:Tripeptidyl aminopeptidase [Dietzia timorensis]|uniref:Tripeptidyl aminopeptidase n=1 Tax=Dietzia timorensis TaxID=499555 RepID=A0A173LRP2_9ACTN|nr:Tripeptidyl aminopeptidase [Dietzia timorensis]